jgi:hypothetical protein
MLQLKGATAPSIYAGQLLEVRARGVWAATSATSFDLFVSRGIADNSPEYGGGMAVVYSF